MLKYLFGETGLFTYIIDRRCFAKKNASRINRWIGEISDDQLWEAAEKADELLDGVAPEILKELARRKKIYRLLISLFGT